MIHCTIFVVILAISSLSKEIDALVNEAEDAFYNPLLLYGEGLNNEISNEGEFSIAISRLLPTLQQVWLIQFSL